MFDSESLEKIREHLITYKLKLAVAESVTAGFMQAAFASAEQASEFFEGGITAYNIDQKVRHLGIDRKKGEQCNCVSAETASQMAAGVIKMFESDYGISVTGYATPVPESGNNLYAFFCVRNREKIIIEGKINAEGLQPEAAQLKYVNEIIGTFANKRALEDEGGA
jgi:nicotinamide-nucleotide amidase